MPCAPPRSARRRSARLGHDPGGMAGTARRDSAGCTPSGSGRRCAPWSARRGCRLPGAAHRPLPRTTRTGRAPGRTGRTGIAVSSLAGRSSRRIGISRTCTRRRSLAPTQTAPTPRCVHDLQHLHAHSRAGAEPTDMPRPCSRVMRTQRRGSPGRICSPSSTSGCSAMSACSSASVAKRSSSSGSSCPC